MAPFHPVNVVVFKPRNMLKKKLVASKSLLSSNKPSYLLSSKLETLWRKPMEFLKYRRGRCHLPLFATRRLNIHLPRLLAPTW